MRGGVGCRLTGQISAFLSHSLTAVIGKVLRFNEISGSSNIRQAPVLDMDVPGLAHSISSPLSPCEGMIKDLSLDAIQLCERDGEAFPFHTAADPVSD